MCVNVLVSVLGRNSPPGEESDVRCWSVNLLNSNRDEYIAANVSLN